VRIVAGAAPQPSAAFANAHAESELLDVADYPEGGSRPRRQVIAVNGERIFERCSGTKIAQLLSRVEYPGDSQQVALLAYAVSRCALEHCGVHDRRRPGMRQVCGGIAVATAATDSQMRKRRRLVLIGCFGDRLCLSRMTEETARRHWAREVWVRLSLVSGRQVIIVAAPVVGDWRLKQVIINGYQVSSGMFARTYRVVNVVFAGMATCLQALPRAVRGRRNGNCGSRYLYFSVGLFAACSHGV
jgi:hypothetical protein